MLFREHRGSFEDSMKTVVEVDTLRDLIDHIVNNVLTACPSTLISGITIRPYSGWDHRNEWNTHIVTVENIGVIGYTNSNDFTEVD